MWSIYVRNGKKGDERQSQGEMSMSNLSQGGRGERSSLPALQAQSECDHFKSANNLVLLC